jgi:hypothetical protein
VKRGPDPPRAHDNLLAQDWPPDRPANDIHSLNRSNEIKFMRQNLGLVWADLIRDRKNEIGIDLAKERA